MKEEFHCLAESPGLESRTLRIFGCPWWTDHRMATGPNLVPRKQWKIWAVSISLKGWVNLLFNSQTVILINAKLISNFFFENSDYSLNYFNFLIPRRRLQPQQEDTGMPFA